MRAVQDKGLFLGKLRTLRPAWDDGRLEREWAYLLTTTNEEEKSYGGPSDSPLQLPIPAWMVGDECVIKELDVFETKQLHSESKGMQMSAQDPSLTTVGRPLFELVTLTFED